VPAMDRGEPFVLKGGNNPTVKAIQDLAAKIVSKIKTLPQSNMETV